MTKKCEIEEEMENINEEENPDNFCEPSERPIPNFDFQSSFKTKGQKEGFQNMGFKDETTNTGDQNTVIGHPSAKDPN